MDRFLIRKMLRPGCFRTSPYSAFADGGWCRRATRPADTTRRSAGRFGSRVRPRHIAMDTRAADAMRPAAAGGLAAGKKTRNRLSIDVDDLAMPVDFQSANGIVDGKRDQRGIEWRLVDPVHGRLLEVGVLAGGDEVVEPGDGLLEILERHALEPVAYHQPGKFSDRIRLEEGTVRGIGDIGVPKLPAIGIDRCLGEDRPDRPGGVVRSARAFVHGQRRVRARSPGKS